MKKENFRDLRSEWEKLNKEYDAYIQEFFDNPGDDSFTEEQINKMKEMQKELYEVERQWFKVAEGTDPVES